MTQAYCERRGGELADASFESIPLQRHGAVGIDAYRDLGYLPEAVRRDVRSLSSWSGVRRRASRSDALARYRQ
jgi:hypothetical protein